MIYTEKELEKMAMPIGKSEEEKCKHAITMVKKALEPLGYYSSNDELRTIEGSFAFSSSLRNKNNSRELTLLVQGSYANKTNIPSESDVDVAVILESTFTTKYRDGITRDTYGFGVGTYSVLDLKTAVYNALKDYCDDNGVERHDKSIKVIGNTYRVDADVVPAYRYRNYENDYLFKTANYVPGIEIKPDSGGSIINYPELHIKNGIKKNKNTDYKFKRHVRIIKGMKEDMKNCGYAIPKSVSSFGLESLLWNIPDEVYGKYFSYRYVFEELVDYLYNNLNKIFLFKEINGMKYLFDERSEADYKKFIQDLKGYYKYES